MKRYFCIPLLFLLLPSVMRAQSPGFIFHNIGERQGLSANFCYSILKDSRGILWIGTINGLSRFDGQHFINFKAGKDAGTFVNNVIYDLCEDKLGNVWGAAASGIFCYQAGQHKFINYIPPTFDFARSVYNILCDKDGNIWASTEWNIVKLNKQKNRFEEVGPLTKSRDSLQAYGVRQNGMIEDPTGGGIWFATRSGLHFYDTQQEKFWSYKSRPGDSLFARHSVAALSLSRSGNIWFFDNLTREVVSFNPRSKKIVHRFNVGNKMPNVFGQTLFEDSQQRLWFSSWDKTMAVIDYGKNIITPVVYRNENPLSIAGDGFWDAWEDSDNNVWLATAGGLSKCNYSRNLYSVIPIVDNVPEFKDGRLGAFSLDPRDRSWWIANDGNKPSVIHYHPETGSYYYFDFSKAVKNKAGQLPAPVYGVNFLDGKPYACTHTGVWLLDEKANRMLPFEKQFEDWPFLPYNYFTAIGDEVWFVTKEGHVKWNKRTNKAIKIRVGADSLKDGQKNGYSRVFIDRSKGVWYVPAFGWLARIAEDNTVELKYYIKDKAKELSGYLTSMTDDKDGNLWMTASAVGLYKYNIAKDEMTLYDQTDGITYFVNQAMLDKQGRIWMAGKNKFSVFNPDTKSISNYNLPVYENTLDYGNALLVDSSGEVLSTLYKDIVKFMPERLNLKPTTASPLVSLIKISGKDKLITDETSLLLEPDENSLEFSFGSLISNEIFPYGFEYQLLGFDKGRVMASSSATALYNNLEPGKYEFRVAAVANDKSWKTQDRILTIIIRTPFYKSSWFWLLMGGLLIAAFVLFYRFRFKKQRQILTLETKAQQLEKEKTMVMYDSLKQQLNPHFLFNSLTSLSGLIDTNPEVAGSFLEQMSGIYRYILKSGDNETVAIKDELSFVKLYISLQQTRFKKGLEVNINVPEEYVHHKIAPVTLQNLIENAIKHNVIDEESPLVIDIFIDSDYLVVENNLQKKNMVETSNKKGLAQFETLYKYLSVKPIVVEESEKRFTIKIPLI